MMEARSFPFGGVPVYNPQSLTKGEAIAQFHARQAAYESLLDLLREERPSHVLIIGTRGMGKTTLLQRVHYGVEEDVALNNRYLVLAFPEEQYNVNRLHHFLLNAVDALADAMERLKNTRMLAHVEDFVEAVSKLGQEEIESRVPKFLAEVSQDLGQSFLMLVDNADRLFDTIEKQEQWRLRDLLSSRPDLTLFGATTQASEGIYGTDRAFFEFFKIHRLTPLTLEEVRQLLLRLSESVEEAEGEKGTAKRRVQEWLDADAARLRTLVQLTGGNPRTTVLLFHLVLDGLGGGAREYLEQLLDQCTPGYKGRVDELPPQAQQVLDAVALKWDPVTAMEIGEDTGLETNIVSTQLTRLVRQGVLEKADPGDSKKALYQVAERFFNIWYLMRASRRVRAKLRWFVEFLRVFFESGDLERMAWDRLEHFRSAGAKRVEEIETAFAYIIASGVDGEMFESYLRRECADTAHEWQPLLGLIRCTVRPGPDKSAGEESVRNIGNLTEAEARLATEINPGSAEAWEILGRVLVHQGGRDDEAEKALRRAVELDEKRISFWMSLAALLGKKAGREDEALEAVRRAIQLSPTSAFVREILVSCQAMFSEGWEGAEVAIRKALELEPKEAWAWGALGCLLARTPERRTEAEIVFRKSIELDPKSSDAWCNLGRLLAEMPSRGEEAEIALRESIRLAPKSHDSWNRLGELLAGMSGRSEESETAFRSAIEIDPKSPVSWHNLGQLLADLHGRRDEAESAFRKAVELDPRLERAWRHLGVCLIHPPERLDEAEACFRKGVELSPKNAWSWSLLGIVLRVTPERLGESEAAFRKAIELNPEPALLWKWLAELLARMPGRSEDAKAAFIEALERDRGSGGTWGNFGVFLASCATAEPAEAENALRKAVELEPESLKNARNLGVLLYCRSLKEEEGIQLIRQGWQLGSDDPVSAAVLAASVGDAAEVEELLPIIMEAAGGNDFWDGLLEPWQNFSPFGKILVRISNLVLRRDYSNKLALLHQAVALAQLSDFPRASVALEDALVGDPIDLLSSGRKAMEIFFAAAVRHGRVEDCIELLDKKEWKDAWRPIYEALRSVQEGSAEYLKRVAVEIREPALIILRRIAPELPGLASQNG